MGFDKSLENYVRVQCVCKVLNHWTTEQEYPEDVDELMSDFSLIRQTFYAEKESFNHQQLHRIIIKHEKIQAVFPNAETILR